MIYLFRKNNKQIALVTGAAAWEMYSSNGDWKYRPIYLGAVTNEAYDAIKEQIQEAVPIDDELVARVNTGKDKPADRELRALNEKRAAMEKDLIEKLALKADKSQVPANMDVVNRDTLQPHEQKALSKLIGA